MLIERAVVGAEQTNTHAIVAPIKPLAGQIAQGDCRILTPLLGENSIDMMGRQLSHLFELPTLAQSGMRFDSSSPLSGFMWPLSGFFTLTPQCAHLPS